MTKSISIIFLGKNTKFGIRNSKQYRMTKITKQKMTDIQPMELSVQHYRRETTFKNSVI
jgi:hypothetical protein